MERKQPLTQRRGWRRPGQGGSHRKGLGGQRSIMPIPGIGQDFGAGGLALRVQVVIQFGGRLTLLGVVIKAAIKIPQRGGTDE